MQSQKLTAEEQKKEIDRQGQKVKKRGAKGAQPAPRKTFTVGFFGEETDGDDEDEEPASKKARQAPRNLVVCASCP